MCSRRILVYLVAAESLFGTQSFTVSARGRIYTVQTQAVGAVLTFNGHWTYQPSVILPSPQTGNLYYLLFNSNLNAGSTSDQAIFLSTSSTGTSGFSAPTPILKASQSSNICDMADARPIWDGTKWHVYVQARDIQSGVCAPAAGIFEATGTSLAAGSLNWVVTSGTVAKKIVTPRVARAPGIGEDQQWFNTLPYRGPSWQPLMELYNDWTYCGQDCLPNCSDPMKCSSICPPNPYNCSTYCPSCNFNGSDMFSYLSPDGTNTFFFWYYRQAAYNSVTGSIWTDAILGGDLDVASKGNPGIGFESGCTGGNTQYNYTRGIGFYNDPMPYDAPTGTTRTPFQGGVYFNGPIEGTVNVTINGVSYARMFHPRVARNIYGYVDSVPGSSPRRWQTYLYYNDKQINRNSTDGCSDYTNWTASQGFAVSTLTITEQ